MGASSSRVEEDKALRLCRERKKFVRQALDGRCSLAAAHIEYVHSLRNAGTALRKFVEPEGPIESSLYTFTDATPEPVALTEESLSHFSFSSPTISQQVDVTENLCPSPAPHTSSQFQASHMKFSGISSKKVEEEPPSLDIGTVTTSSTPENSKPHGTENEESSLFEKSSIPAETPPWDYFGPRHPIDQQFSFKEEKGMKQGFENVDDLRKLREEEGIPELEDEEGNASFRGREESLDSEDEFDEPSADTLVRSFENFNQLHDHNAAGASPTMPFGSVASESEFMNGEKCNSPDLSPVRATSSRASLSSNTKKRPVKEDCIENKVNPKDFLSIMKDIEYLFIKAADSGKEVPRMLEANKLHFRPMLQANESGSMAFTFFKACFSCGEEHSEVEEEPAQNSIKYLTWHRTESSRTSSSRTPLGLNSKDEVEDLNSDVFDSIHMISSSHASTLDRLYAWERKLYDEVKACEMVRRVYESKCKTLRQLESKGESPARIDKTRAVVKDLRSRIRVAIHRIESISKRIEELRDTELQLQLEELIGGLSQMWEAMYECHKLQYQIISVAFNNGNNKISIQSDSQRQITIDLEFELSSLSSSFTKWISAQKSYLQAIKDWLYKCVYLPKKYSKRKRPRRYPALRDSGPPIYATCDVWLENLDQLHPEHVTDSIKNLATQIIRSQPHQEKNQGRSATRLSTTWNADNASTPAITITTDEASEDWISGFDRFQSCLVDFIGQLNNFSKDSVDKYAKLLQAIKDAKNNYTGMINRDAKSNADLVRSNC